MEQIRREQHSYSASILSSCKVIVVMLLCLEESVHDYVHVALRGAIYFVFYFLMRFLHFV